MSDNRPRHRRIAADLRARVMSGEFAPGAQLPSTAQLTEHYGAPNATIQAALKDLKGEGFVFGERGRGVYVRDRVPMVVRVGVYFEPSPDGYSYRVLDVVEEAQPPADVATVLGPGPAVLRTRLMLYAGHPVELSWTYYPADIAAGTELTRRAKIRGGAPRVLADLGYRERRFVDRVSARLPTTEELEALDMPDDVPVIRQFRVVYSDHDRPVEVSIGIKGAHLHEIEYHEPAHD